MAKMAKGGFSHAAMEKTLPLINHPSTLVGEEIIWAVVFPGDS
jgi:hypothetical protein